MSAPRPSRRRRRLEPAASCRSARPSSCPAAAPRSCAASPGPARRPDRAAAARLDRHRPTSTSSPATTPPRRALPRRRDRPSRTRSRHPRPRSVFRLEDCADDASPRATCSASTASSRSATRWAAPSPSSLWQRHPDRVDGLVLCATSRLLRRRRARSGCSFLGMSGLAALARLTPAQARRWLTDQLYLQRKPTTWEPWAIEEASLHDWRMVLEAGRAIGASRSRAWIGEVDVPTSVVITMRDRVVPVRRQMRLFEAIPGAEAFRVDGDHDVVVAEPERFVAALAARRTASVERSPARDRDARSGDRAARPSHPGAVRPIRRRAAACAPRRPSRAAVASARSSPLRRRHERAAAAATSTSPGSGSTSAARYASTAARKVFASAERRVELDRERELKTAEAVAERLGNMKGALMKLGQMASYVDEGLPAPLREALSQLQSNAPPMSARPRRRGDRARARRAARPAVRRVGPATRSRRRASVRSTAPSSSTRSPASSAPSP